MKTFMSDDRLAPVVLFVYNRPWHTEQTLRALQANDLADQSVLYIYSDAPKLSASEEVRQRVDEVRRLIRSEQWCGEVHVIESPYNLGLVGSFVKGITEVVDRHGRVIVLEDDQITSKGFLKYLNEALELYEDDEQVMHISAYMYPAEFESEETTFFINVQSCPGWATWKRAWDLYNHDAADHVAHFSRSPALKKKFDIEGHAYFYAQLEKNVEVPNFSWAVRWYASCLRAGGLSLFPAKSLVRNIGIDGTGVHCRASDMYDVEPVDYLDIDRVPLIENTHIRKSVDEFYRKHIRRPAPFSVRKAVRALRSSVTKVGRRLLTAVYPELRALDRESPMFSVEPSSLSNNTISSRARLYAPYHIWDSVIGDYSYVSRNAWISATHIGKFCSIGPNFTCGWGIHPVDGISTSPMFYSTARQNGTSLCSYNKVQERKPIHIGNDVFIGMNVTVLDGVTIGDGAVVGAGTVVSKDVPPYAIVVGNPMQILRYRFSEEVIGKLLEIAWWDWGPNNLRKVEEHFQNVGAFIAMHRNHPS